MPSFQWERSFNYVLGAKGKEPSGNIFAEDVRSAVLELGLDGLIHQWQLTKGY